jgi:hypothetical protein
LLHALGMFATGKPNRPIKFFFSSDSTCKTK